MTCVYGKARASDSADTGTEKIVIFAATLGS